MDRGEVCAKFLESIHYALYPFQEEALLAWFEAPGGILVSAPTGMGKTLIAEAAVFEALHTNRRCYYTTPLIALTDQKFREFQDKAEAWGFPRESIGLITGNRKENPDALVRVVVAEILLNHLLAGEPPMDDVASVVMDEFHSFNDIDRGIVWELSLVLLPKTVRLMLLSATVGNIVDFLRWLREQHGRDVQLVQTSERKIPLEFVWVGDKLLTEHLPDMVSKDDTVNRAPALVFCFDRDECWEVAEKLKGLKLIDQQTKSEVENVLSECELTDGIGPKLRQMLLCGVGVHHAGVLPKYKEIVETLFLRKLMPFVVCTETLAAGINLPARSVVLSTLLKGKRGEKKLIPSSAAHQMFGRAGRPQFDKQGYVFALAPEDDARIAKWKKKFDQIDPNSKDLGIMRARKDMERKRPSRRNTEQYWMEGQFRTLIQAGPAKIFSQSMIPYQFLVYLLAKTGSLADVRQFLSKRFTSVDRIAKFQDQLGFMVQNLAKFGHLTVSEDGEHVTLLPSIHELLSFRSVDPLYGGFLVNQLKRSSFEEKILALESVLSVPPTIERLVRIPEEMPKGPLQTEVLEPLLIQIGIVVARPDNPDEEEDVDDDDPWATGDEPVEPRNLPTMLKALFDARLASPEPMFVQAKWCAGRVFEYDRDFYKFIRGRDLGKNEGLILRHLLRLTILAGEFHARSGGDPDYERIGQQCTDICRQVDPRYTDRFLAAEDEAKKMGMV